MKIKTIFAFVLSFVSISYSMEGHEIPIYDSVGIISSSTTGDDEVWDTCVLIDSTTVLTSASFIDAAPAKDQIDVQFRAPLPQSRDSIIVKVLSYVQHPEYIKSMFLQDRNKLVEKNPLIKNSRYNIAILKLEKPIIGLPYASNFLENFPGTKSFDARNWYFAEKEGQLIQISQNMQVFYNPQFSNVTCMLQNQMNFQQERGIIGSPLFTTEKNPALVGILSCKTALSSSFEKNFTVLTFWTPTAPHVKWIKSHMELNFDAASITSLINYIKEKKWWRLNN